MAGFKDKKSSNKIDIQHLLLQIVLIAVIVAILFLMITFLYIPSLSYKIFGVASFSTFTGMDSTFSVNSLVVTKKTPFEELVAGQHIIFNVTGYGKNADGLKSYTIATKLVGEDGAISYIVSSGGAQQQWPVTESMYLGEATYSVKGLGMITGFFGSWVGLVFLVIIVVVVALIIYVVKKPEKVVPESVGPVIDAEVVETEEKVNEEEK